jgi:hypothetical protein
MNWQGGGVLATQAVVGVDCLHREDGGATSDGGSNLGWSIGSL